MKYKETARSPQYGRIYGYNDAGKKIEELDWLELEVEHNGKILKVKDILETALKTEQHASTLAIQLNETNQKLVDAKRTIATDQHKFEILVRAVEKINEQLKALKGANTVL